MASASEYVPEYASKDQEFESYVNGKNSRRPTTVALIAHIELLGPKSRKVEGEIVSQVSRDDLFRRTGATFQHTGFVQGSDNYKLCFDTKVKRPMLDWRKVQEWKINDLNVDVDAEIALKWGRNCDSDKKVRFYLLVMYLLQEVVQ